MSWRLRFDSAAELELNEAVGLLDDESPGLGGVFLDDVERTLAKLAAEPHSAPLLDAHVRRQLLPKFPFAVLYSLRRSEIRILAVASQKRPPFLRHGRR